MALTSESFLKIISIAPNMGVSSGTYHNGTTPLPVDSPTAITRKFVNRVEDLTTLSVYFNGQLIQADIEPTIATDARFYYTVVNTLSTISGDVVPESDIVIAIKPNPSYLGYGYTSVSPTPGAFISTDSFTVSYYYTIYTVV